MLLSLLPFSVGFIFLLRSLAAVNTDHDFKNRQIENVGFHVDEKGFILPDKPSIASESKESSVATKKPSNGTVPSGVGIQRAPFVVDQIPVRFSRFSYQIPDHLVRECWSYGRQHRCEELPRDCMSCLGPFAEYPHSIPKCEYGKTVHYLCSVPEHIPCTGDRSFLVKGICRYCFLTEPHEHRCTPRVPCRVTSPKPVIHNCSVNSDVVCIGSRQFPKMKKLECSNGYSWHTAMWLSVTLGGFGVDRFYLGHWREGLGKFFSFGGLGVWTLVDIVLVYLGYVRPEDGSLYIDL